MSFVGDIVGDVFGGGADTTRDAAGQIQFNPFNINASGLGDVTASGNNFATDLNPQLKFLSDRFQSLAGNGLFNLLSEDRGASVDAGNAAIDQAQQGLFGLGSLNPTDIAREQFNQLEDILQPGRDRNRASTEARLFSQGRLDSTGGARQLSEFEQGIERERQANLLNIFNNAQDSVSQNIGNIGSLAGIGSGLFSDQFNRALSGTQASIGINQLPLDLIDRSIAAGGGGVQASNARANLLAQAGQQQAGATSDLFGAALGGLTLFSDRKFKKNINKVGEVNGLNIYEFEYNREYLPKGVQLGVMSDEVAKVIPQAIVKCNDFNLVDYEKVYDYARAA